MSNENTNKKPFIKYSEDEFNHKKKNRNNQIKNKRRIKQALRNHDWESVLDEEDSFRKN